MRRGRRREEKKEKITFDGGGRRRISEGLTLCRLRQNVLFFCGIGGLLLASECPPRNDIGEGRFTGKQSYLRRTGVIPYGLG